MKHLGLGRQLSKLARVVCCCVFAACLCWTLPAELHPQAASAVVTGAVARLSLLDGEAHVTTSGYNAEPVDAALNMPLAAGQSVQTGANADTEVEFTDGSVLRSSASSSATLIRMQPQTEIGLDDGLYYLELRAGGDPQFLVYAGDISIEPKENASFRVRVQNGQPEVAVLRGGVSVARAGRGTVVVQRGERLRTDSKDNRRYLLADTIGPEPGDSWNERRAQQAADAAASQTIAREDYARGQGYGWSDLDSNGSWYPLPGEGLVWQPYGVDASFDPYGYGSWVYGGFGAGGGYVWASGYPWGWLPYHCGSWGFFPGFGWGWQPAAGCRSYGGGWPVGGFPVKHPPHGWRGPLPPRPPVPGGIVTRHPTLPVASSNGAGHLLASRPYAPQPVQVSGVTLHPLAPVASAPTPHGSSAVGSALRRDYPVQNGTHVPLLGLEGEGIAATPGRAPEWHVPESAQSKAEEYVRDHSATVVAADTTSSGSATEPMPDVRTEPGAALSTTRGASDIPSVPGWHSRVPSAVPSAASPAGAGSISVRPSGVRPLPGSAGAVPFAPPVPRAPVIAPPVRTAPVAAPAPAPHFSMPPPPAPVHISAPSPAPAPAPAATRPK